MNGTNYTSWKETNKDGKAIFVSKNITTNSKYSILAYGPNVTTINDSLDIIKGKKNNKTLIIEKKKPDSNKSGKI